MRKQRSGITLIALIITVIVLLILAGITINLTIGQGGIMNRAQEAGVKSEEATAREKLELVLLDLRVQKASNKAYNKNEYVDNVISNNGMDIYLDIVTVDGWQYEIDREELKIVQSLGRETGISKDTRGKASFEYDKTKYLGQVDVKINVSDDAKMYTVQYNTQENNNESTNWITYNLEDSITVSKNGYIYGRFVNLETNEIGYRFKALIDNIDATKPEHANIVLDKEEVNSDETINAVVSMKDNESEIDVENSKYIINETQEEIGIDSTAWDTATEFTSNPQTIQITRTGPKTYYLHVLSTDGVGNKIETVSGKMKYKGMVTYMDTQQFGRNNYAGFENFTTVGSSSSTQLRVDGGETAYIVSKKMYDIENISKIIMWCKTWSSGGGFGVVSFGLSKSNNSADLDVKVQKNLKEVSGELNLELDVSGLEGAYYIKIVLTHSGPSSLTAYMTGPGTIKSM